MRSAEHRRQPGRGINPVAWTVLAGAPVALGSFRSFQIAAAIAFLLAAMHVVGRLAADEQARLDKQRQQGMGGGDHEA